MGDEQPGRQRPGVSEPAIGKAGIGLGLALTPLVRACLAALALMLLLFGACFAFLVQLESS